MPSLKEFVEALQAGWFPALVAVIGCSIVLVGNWYGVPYLANIPSWTATTAVIVGVFAASILFANIVYAPVALFKAAMSWRARKAWRSKIGKLVEEAPEQEQRILAYLVSARRRAFAAKVNDPRLVPLEAKGIICRRPPPNDVLAWPFVVQDEVWEYLLANKERFAYEDADVILDPFYWRNPQGI